MKFSLDKSLEVARLIVGLTIGSTKITNGRMIGKPPLSVIIVK